VATTTPQTFEGEPVLTPDKVAAITDWYHMRLADSDKADHDDALYWQGCADALADVLALLHHTETESPDTTEENQLMIDHVRTLHIGVDPRHLLTVMRRTRAQIPGLGWTIDGDGWETWGEAVGTDLNDDRTLHLTSTVLLPDDQALQVVDALAGLLTAMVHTGPGSALGVLTHFTDWSEQVATIGAHGVVIEQVRS